MKGITDTVVAYKLVWIRVLCYFLIPFGTAFLIAAEKITGVEWEAMHWFDRTKLLGSCSLTGIVAFVAFLDSSMQRAKVTAEELREKRELETRFIRKDEPNG